MSDQAPPPPPPPPGGGQNPQQGWNAPPPPPAAGGQPPAYGQQPPAYGQEGGYGSMPGAPAPQPGPVAAGPRPKALDNAVKLMQLGGLLSLLSLITVFFTTDDMRKAVEDQAAKQGTSMDPDVVDAAVSLGIGFAVAFALLGVGLWFWMAAMNGKGKSWARVVATVFFGIQVLSFVFSFTQAQPILNRLLSIVMVAIGAAAIYFMYRPESSQYYQAQSRPRY